MSDQTYAALEDALRAHVADETGGANIVTDWYLILAAQEVKADATQYLHITSEAPLHTLHGLMSIGMRRLLHADYLDAD